MIYINVYPLLPLHLSIALTSAFSIHSAHWCFFLIWYVMPHDYGGIKTMRKHAWDTNYDTNHSYISQIGTNHNLPLQSLFDSRLPSALYSLRLSPFDYEIPSNMCPFNSGLPSSIHSLQLYSLWLCVASTLISLWVYTPFYSTPFHFASLQLCLPSNIHSLQLYSLPLCTPFDSVLLYA